jgi:signal transduction histidine kinase
MVRRHFGVNGASMTSGILQVPRENDSTLIVPGTGSYHIVTDKVPEPARVPARSSGRSRSLVILSGTLMCLLGGAVLTGWFTQAAPLVKVLPRWPEMQFPSAVAMTLFGLALLVAPLGRRGSIAAGVLGIFVFLVGVIALLEYAINFEVPPRALMEHYLGPDSPIKPGRMSSNTAACWIVAGGALALVFLPRGGFRPRLPASAAAFLGGLNLVVITGLLLDLQPGYGWSNVTPTGFLVAMGLLVGAVGLGAAAMQWSPHDRSLAPPWLPFPVALFVFVISVAISQVAFLLESDRIEVSVQTASRGLADIVTREMRARISTARRMAARWEMRKESTRAEWTTDARAHLVDIPDMVSIAWVDSAHTAKWVVGREGTEWREGMSFAGVEDLAGMFEQARSSHAPAIRAANDASSSVIICIPTSMVEHGGGFMLWRFNAAEWLPSITPLNYQRFYLTEVTIDGVPVHSNFDAPQRLSVSESFNLAGANWRSTVALTPATRSRITLPLPAAGLAAGLLGALLVGISMRWALRASYRAHELRHVRDQLENRVMDRTRKLANANSSLRDEAREREAAQKALLRKTRELEMSNSELEEFAYVASHDLQEPLRKINSFAELLLEEVGEGLDNQRRDYLVRMQSAARRMNTMIRDLLELSRSSHGGVKFAVVDMSAVVREVLTDLEASITDSGARIVIGALPDVSGERVLVAQVLRNLLTNAIKYRKKDGPLEIRIAGRTLADGDIEIAVADNGIGFDQAYADQIFKPFHRLHSHTEYPGTGIGLAVCRKILERHGGSVRAEGRPGEGATFRIRLLAASEAKV